MSQPNKSGLTRHDTVKRLVTLLQHRMELMIHCLPNWHFNTAHRFITESLSWDNTIKSVSGCAGDFWATTRLVQRLGWQVDSWTCDQSDGYVEADNAALPGCYFTDATSKDTASVRWYQLLTCRSYCSSLFYISTPQNNTGLDHPVTGLNKGPSWLCMRAEASMFWLPCLLGFHLFSLQFCFQHSTT